jgi:hypothetical protein
MSSSVEQEAVSRVITPACLHGNDMCSIEHFDHVNPGHHTPAVVALYCLILELRTAITTLYLSGREIASNLPFEWGMIDLHSQRWRSNVREFDQEYPSGVVVRDHPTLTNSAPGSMLREDKHWKSQCLRILHRLHLICVTAGSTSGLWVVINDVILVEIVRVVTTGVEDGDRNTRITQRSRRADIDPDACLAAIDTTIIELRWEKLRPVRVSG